MKNQKNIKNRLFCIEKRSLWIWSGILILFLAGCRFPGGKAEPLENGKLKVGMYLQLPSLCYLSEETSKPERFEAELAGKLAEKMGLELEIVDTSEENLLKSLDADLYDCVISGVGLSQWNETHYSHTMPYADISSVQEKTGRDTKYTELSIFTKKGNPMAGELEKNLQELWKDGTLKALSQKYFEKDITLKLQEKK